MCLDLYFLHFLQHAITFLRVYPGTEIYACDAIDLIVMRLSQGCEHPPFALVEPSVVLIGQDHLSKMTWLIVGTVDSRDQFVLVHADKANVSSEILQQFVQAVSDADTFKLIRIVRPHQLVIVDLAEGGHSDLGFVLPYGVPDIAILVTLSEVTARSEESLHRVIQLHVGSAVNVTFC
jgi:hypothetical protein